MLEIDLNSSCLDHSKGHLGDILEIKVFTGKYTISLGFLQVSFSLSTRMRNETFLYIAAFISYIPKVESCAEAQRYDTSGRNVLTLVVIGEKTKLRDILTRFICIRLSVRTLSTNHDHPIPYTL